MIKIHHTHKFYMGIFLVITSLIIGKVTLAIFLLYFENILIRWTTLIIYLTSWVMLILGVFWVGKEYAKEIQKYFSYRYYHRSAKAGAKKAYHKTRNIHTTVRSKLKRKST